MPSVVLQFVLAGLQEYTLALFSPVRLGLLNIAPELDNEPIVFSKQMSLAPSTHLIGFGIVQSSLLVKTTNSLIPFDWLVQLFSPPDWPRQQPQPF